MTAPRLGWWWALAPLLLLGLGVFALGEVRAGGFLVAAAVAVAALLRLVLPTARAGGLAVRSRTVDVLTLTALAVGLAVVTGVLDLTPRG